ncbi:MAG: hypothetical protein MZV65_38995 [Chromatiales bacterium]|nr:hypothetical protein [Chromatiales bacterium]
MAEPITPIPCGPDLDAAPQLAVAAQTIHHYVDTEDARPRWFAWDRDVDVARSQIAGDEQSWMFYTGDGAPKAVNQTMNTGSGGPPAESIALGVGAPQQVLTTSPLSYTPPGEPAELWLSASNIGAFTVEYGLYVSFDGGATYSGKIALGTDPVSGAITAVTVAAALNGLSGSDVTGATQTLSATASGEAVQVVTSGTGERVSIHIKYADDEYGYLSALGGGGGLPELWISAGAIRMFDSWVFTTTTYEAGSDGIPQQNYSRIRTRLYGAGDVMISSRVWGGYTESGGEEPVTAAAFRDWLGAAAHVDADIHNGDVRVWLNSSSPNRGRLMLEVVRFKRDLALGTITPWPPTISGFDQTPDAYSDVAYGSGSTPASVTLSAYDLGFLNSTDDVYYTIDEHASVTRLQVSGTSASAIAALFDAEPWLAAEVVSGAVVVRTVAAGSDNLPSGYPHWRAALAISYAKPSDNILSATGSQADDPPIETRVYAYTWVSSVAGWERESAPSPASASLDVFVGQGVRVTRPAETPDPQATHWRLYRSVDGTYLLASPEDIALDVTVYDDTLAADDLGEELPSLTWDAPPSGLRGLISLPNGMMAGFLGQDVYFCEPYRAHAWPSNYVMTVDYPIVGLGRLDTTLVVLTVGVPYIIQGSHPDSLVMVKADIEQACLAKRSIATIDNAIFYASPDGLMRLTTGGSELVTTALMTRAQWQALDPSDIHAYAYDGKYMAFYGNGRSGGFVYDTREAQFYFHEIGRITAGYTDLLEDRLYVAAAGGLVLAPWGEGAPCAGVWQSKRFAFPQITGFSCVQLEAEHYPTEAPIRLEVIADDVVVFARDVLSRTPMRLPAVQARDWEVRFTVPVEIFNVALAQSMSEIASV